MSYVTTPLCLADITTTHTTPTDAKLGELRQFNDSKYRYVKASAAIAQYAFVKIDDDWTAAEGTTTLLPNTEPAKVGCAQIAFASADYGWVAVEGAFTGKFAASCVQDVKIYTTGTAGIVDDAATTLIQGLKLITTITAAASAPCFATQEMVTVAA